MCNACIPILVGVAFLVLELKFGETSLSVHDPKGKFRQILTPKPKRPHPPKLVYMHYTSTPTCMNFLSQF